MRKRIWILTVAAAVRAQDWSALEAVAREELRATQAPGAAVGVVKGERVVLLKGFGAASLETGGEVTPEMLFRLGSTTKMFTAAAVVTLAEEGKLHMDRPIGEYVARLHPKLSRVTAHQLLTHTAGITDEAPWYGPHDDTALASGIRAWDDGKFFSEPGKVYAYSNPGYWAAGFLVEQVSGKPFADFVRERLLEPLGMTSSTFRPTMAMTYPLAQGHEGGKVVRPAADNASGWPAGSLFSSTRDLAQFCIAFLNGGRGPLTPSVIAQLSTGYVEVPKSSDRYGYGLRVGTHRGLRLVWHNGNRRGYGSSIRMAPEQRVAVILLVNRSGGNLPKTSDLALELATGH
jgi:CubicO group peptidase (beta-lactamase class C family)